MVSELGLDEVEVVLLAEGDVVDLVAYVSQVALLHHRHQDVVEGVGRDVEVPRHSVNHDVAKQSAAFFRFDFFSDPLENRSSVVLSVGAQLRLEFSSLGDSLLDQTSLNVDVVGAHHILHVHTQEVARETGKHDVDVNCQLVCHVALVHQQICFGLYIEISGDFSETQNAQHHKANSRH